MNEMNKYTWIKPACLAVFLLFGELDMQINMLRTAKCFIKIMKQLLIKKTSHLITLPSTKI